MAIKVQEMKDDAIVSVKVNKSYYLMCKALSFFIVKQLDDGKGDPSTKLADIMSKEYKDLDEIQRSFYTVALLLAEIEKQARAENLTDEKEVLEPGDEGYVAPTIEEK
jgi:hydrogenase maturation factor HypF (carbamoyltransferase family)